MPQGRHKTPFSNKQKKSQLQAKRELKKGNRPHHHHQVSTLQSTSQGPAPSSSSTLLPQQTFHPRQRLPFVSDDGDIEDELDEDDQNEDKFGNDNDLSGDNVNGSENNNSNNGYGSKIITKGSDQSAAANLSKIHIINAQRNVSSSRNVNRYALQFFTESDQEIRDRKERAQKPFKLLPEKEGLVCSVEDMFGESSTSDSSIPIAELDMPKRPSWSPGMSVQSLNSQEQKYFNNYLNELFNNARARNWSLSYFDLNIETWRQLWRVIEMSDIILLVSDIRHPIFHFPPSLYHYVVDDLHKDMILVLNKIDLVDARIVLAWREYLKAKFPKLNILEFASYAGMRVRAASGKRIGKLRMAVKGASALQKMVAKIVKDKADLSSWKQKIESEYRECENASMDDDDSSYYESDEDDDRGKRSYKKAPPAANKGTSRAQLEKRAENVFVQSADTSYYEQVERFKDGIVTIGCVGHPNVGKSSLLNALYGKKVVSVSRTPGHTKHFQTIFLTDNVRLCDCPGLVFPSRAPKALQVLMGCYPISQLREPYTAIQFLAERINLVRLLRLQHPEGDTETTWTAYDICESWAEKRGFLTARTGRPDVYRAANHLLRMSLDGRTICLAFHPPLYHEKDPSHWSTHPELGEIESIQNRKLVEETLNKNLMRQCHGQGYVDSHASSVEADVDEGSSDDNEDEDLMVSGGCGGKFALLEVVDDDDC